MDRRNNSGEGERRCAGCGETFFYALTAGRRPVYCSPACKQKAYRRRKQPSAGVELKTRINVTTQEVTLTLTGRKVVLTLADLEVLTERLLKARQLLTAVQPRIF